MPASFANQTALITGGSSGIGLATAQALAKAGAHVWLLARDPARLAMALETVRAARQDDSQQVGGLSADVADSQAVAAVLGPWLAEHGAPDLLINSAGITHPGLVVDLALERFEQMMAINYLGTVYVTKAVLPGMLARGCGHIVNLSSQAGFLGIVGYSAYGATKYALRGFSDVLRAEVKPAGVRVSIVFPPDVDTPQLAYETPFKPAEMVALEEVVGATKPMAAETVAQAILKGVARNQYLIIPGLDGKLFFTFSNLIGGGIYPLMDFLLRLARRKVQRQTKITSTTS